MKIPLRSPILLTIIVIIVTVACFFAYRQINSPASEQRYRLHTAELGDINQTVSANGTINPVTMVSVGTQVSGRVKKLYADNNSMVSQGDILLELDASILEAQLKQSMASVLSASASLDLATANKARMQNLFSQDYVSQQELDVTVQANKSAAAQLQAAQAQVERDQANLAYAIIRSPVSGVVIDKQVEVGQTVASSFQTPTLFKIAQDLANMQIDASFAEADIGNIKVEQNARFTVDAFPNRGFIGKVKLIRLNPVIQQNVVTYNVVINVDNPDKILLPGMTAYVSITVEERKEVLVVPNAALRYQPSSELKPQKTTANAPAKKRDTYSGKVFVLENGEPRLRNVSPGITDNRITEITQGELKPGEQLILGEMSASGQSSRSSSTRRMRF
ncbi:MAG: efflux RND transporter periplasmic adaptor subunit [Gallionella sp.]